MTNSWAKSRCHIIFERNDNIVKLKTRSSWEAFFQLVNTNLVYEKVVIPYKLNGEERNYIVDFVDYENKVLYEIKPKSERNTKIVKTKKKYAIKWSRANKYTYKVISDDWFHENYDKYSHLINNQPDFDKMYRNLKQFKNEN